MQKQDDFQGIFKWKFLVPIIFILNWICMIFGPIFFSYGYQIYCFIIIGFSLIKTAGLGISSAYALYKLKKIVESSEATTAAYTANKNNIANTINIYHTIIIPSYKEDEQVLQETLNKLAMHPTASKNFLIFLAMQNHEQGCDQKAGRLITENKNQFKYIGFTKHVLREGQAKGKASNVSWCAEHLLQNLEGMMIPKEEIMLTIMDADSWAPKQYFYEIQKYIQNNKEHFDTSFFSAPQIFTRNHLDVPVFNRVYDQMHSSVHLSTMVAFYFSLPLSNYSISYSLIERIGFWDTNPDAIGEDFHTFQKCFWKAEGPIHSVPIYTPFNQLSLVTGNGYCSDLKARFKQLQRHTRAVSDVAYCCNMLTKTKFQFRNLILTILVIQVFVLAAVVPWALVAIGIQYVLVTDQAIHHFPRLAIDIVLNLTPAFTLISYIFYELFKRVGNKNLYNQKNDSIWRVIEYPILFVVGIFIYSLPAFIISSFGVLCSKTQYTVTEKHLDKKQKKEPQQTNLIKVIPKQIQNNSHEIIHSDEDKQKANSSDQSTKSEILDKKKKNTQQQISPTTSDNQTNKKSKQSSQ